MIPAL